MNKIVSDAAAAVADIPDGATILVGGFGVLHAWPTTLLEALKEQGARDLTLICNIGGVGATSPQLLAEKGQIRKLIASYGAVPKRETPLDDAIRAGEVELELVPQGTLIERVRAGGSGLAAFYTPTGVGTDLAHGKEEREFGGRRFLLETALRADFALDPGRGRRPARQPRLPGQQPELQSAVRDGGRGDDRRGGRGGGRGRAGSRGGDHAGHPRRPGHSLRAAATARKSCERSPPPSGGAWTSRRASARSARAASHPT